MEWLMVMECGGSEVEEKTKILYDIELYDSKAEQGALVTILESRLDTALDTALDINLEAKNRTTQARNQFLNSAKHFQLHSREHSCPLA